jgi:hypothetical protein
MLIKNKGGEFLEINWSNIFANLPISRTSFTIKVANKHWPLLKTGRV